MTGRLACLSLLLVAPAAPAWAAFPALGAISAGPPEWVITSASGPTYFKPGSTDDVYIVTATNIGGEAMSGPITITDTLPAGVRATRAPYASHVEGGEAFTDTALHCPESAPPATFTCTYADEAGHEVAPGDTVSFTIPVEVEGIVEEGTELLNRATVSGGAATASTSEPTTEPTPATSRRVPFGVASLFALPSTALAGTHPNFTTSLTLNLEAAEASAESPREISVDLPAGLTGDPLAAARCDIDEINRGLCPRGTVVGIATLTVGHTQQPYTNRYVVPVYNIVPYHNEPAAFAFSILEGLATARLDTTVIPDSGGEYAVHVSIRDVNESEPLVSSSVTLWGVPAQFNGPGPDKALGLASFGGPDESVPATPFMRNPTSCAGSLSVGLETDSWQEAGAFRALEAPFPALGGCELLSPLFVPTLQVSPDSTQAGAPAGYAVKLEVPQSESSQTLATPDLRTATVTLPAGTVTSPSAANGLQACSDAQLDRASVERASCPPASQIGTLRIKTPLLEEQLTGQVFLGQPECSPCEASDGRPAAAGRMLRLFLQAQGSGVRIKLAGRTHVDEQTGQLTTVFEDNPQQPFERLTLQLDGGPTAPLANPSACGVATTSSQLIPWSSTPAAPFAAEPSSSFQVGGCAAPRFAPSFSAGMSASAQAGAYSPLSVTFSRSDQDQQLGGITVRTPPGLLGMVSHVTLCGEAQASAGTCPPASQIGTVSAAAGPGPEPIWITGGRAYLTGPYKDAPFGLSIVVPAVAGPFNLGQERVRAAIFVDRDTGALTVVSDPVPTMKDGIPFQVKTVNVNVNRPQFTFNSTNCDPLAIGATISSTQGAAAGVSAPYQAQNCAGLPFKPSFAVSTQGATSKANGASLDVKVAQRPGEANIHRVDTRLPLALPSRLTTLQQACREAQFAANPAGCPAGSNVGMAIAHTPVLSAPLAGPAYLVSHGGAAFPDLDIILQGEGVTIYLTGHTDIKKGITYSHFETLPDAPASSFELKLPEGPHSALAAFGNLCKPTNTVTVRKRVAVRRHGRTVHLVRSLKETVPATLQMPTTIVGQNGAQLKQTTHIAVTGCAKARRAKGKAERRTGRSRSGRK
jgi:hypothetical protein